MWKGSLTAGPERDHPLRAEWSTGNLGVDREVLTGQWEEV